MASVIPSLHTILQSNGQVRVELRWIPGHKGYTGNERADIIAKAAANDPPVIHSTLTWAREKAKHRALKAWRNEWAWASLPHTNQAAIALRRTPPTLRLSQSLREIDASRDVQSRVIQSITGHGHIGDCYARFVPTEPSSCPCGEPLQTRDHILTDCDLHNDHRHILHKACPTLSTSFILGTRKGINALAHFLKDSEAFKKARSELQVTTPSGLGEREPSPL
jgi:hypothetical protein